MYIVYINKKTSFTLLSMGPTTMPVAIEGYTAHQPARQPPGGSRAAATIYLCRNPKLRIFIIQTFLRISKVPRAPSSLQYCHFGEKTISLISFSFNFLSKR